MTRRHRFLMCPPTFFEVSYVINPWMHGNVDHVQSMQALQQWQSLNDTLSGHAEVVLVDAAAGLPDMPFTANAGLVYGNTFVPSRFRHVERRGEEPHFEQWFGEQGFRMSALPGDVFFEGAGDALLDRGQSRLWMGHGHRTDLASAPMLQAALGIDVVPLRLIDSRFYHLDTCF